MLIKKVGEIKNRLLGFHSSPEDMVVTLGKWFEGGEKRGHTTSLGREGCLSRGLEWCGVPLLRRNIASLCGWLLEVDLTPSIVLGLWMIWIRCVGYAMNVKNR